MTQKEYAFSLNDGKSCFLVAGGDGVIRIFIEGENNKECHLRLSTTEYQKMVDNFTSLLNLFQDTQN